ncbi:hypothetical protein [Thermosyntropha sp.]|nr:hypothetical protein [Thermosyntropha sp.]MBO8158081.1 hypothetical protein [Thermosyntropha sp.]
MPAQDVELQIVFITKVQAAINELKEETEMTVNVQDNIITAAIQYPDSIS